MMNVRLGVAHRKFARSNLGRQLEFPVPQSLRGNEFDEALLEKRLEDTRRDLAISMFLSNAVYVGGGHAVKTCVSEDGTRAAFSPNVGVNSHALIFV
eukprot:6174562-Pleurochrysis_carterae.AAC.6